jgi:hypothetical protein
LWLRPWLGENGWTTAVTTPAAASRQAVLQHRTSTVGWNGGPSSFDDSFATLYIEEHPRLRTVAQES